MRFFMYYIFIKQRCAFYMYGTWYYFTFKLLQRGIHCFDCTTEDCIAHALTVLVIVEFITECECNVNNRTLTDCQVSSVIIYKNSFVRQNMTFSILTSLFWFQNRSKHLGSPTKLMKILTSRDYPLISPI